MSDPAVFDADLMQGWEMTVDRLITHAERWHGTREVVTRLADGRISRTTWAATAHRARQVTAALIAQGIAPGTRIGTLAMNSARHVEVWYGVMGHGAVCHTLNPRLFDDQLIYMINHADDRWIFVDPVFRPLMERLLPHCPGVAKVIYLGDPGEAGALSGAAVDYEALIAGADPASARWGQFSERDPAALCYTSGTTGNPKGVQYSHRSQLLHTLISGQKDFLGLSSRDTLLSVVPMFHVNAWGLPFIAAAAGSKLVLPGARLDGAAVYELLETEAVTFTAAVPTVWQLLLDFLTVNQLQLTTLKRVAIGGSACTEALIRGFRDGHGVEVLHAWGMTEMSPIGTISGPLPPSLGTPDEATRMAYNLKQGRVPFGVDMKITSDDGVDQPHDGAAPGHIKVAGPSILQRYFRDDKPAVDAEGYFDTGDIGTIDPHGYLQITDRSKDLIKSGGEWISSVEIENIASGHPKALLAAVIAIPHPKWRERPLLVIQLRPGETATAEEMLAFLKGKIATWWIPDGVQFIEAMPLGATGKLDKKVLRARYATTAA
ncbi:MAG: long-chain fatty acid--CoA ligase [Pseudomonadota bacterium]|jgi:fatty-acyl-CoA synthase